MVCELIKALLDAESIKFHVVESRTKKLESLDEKIVRKEMGSQTESQLTERDESSRRLKTAETAIKAITENLGPGFLEMLPASARAGLMDQQSEEECRAARKARFHSEGDLFAVSRRSALADPNAQQDLQRLLAQFNKKENDRP